MRTFDKPFISEIENVYLDESKGIRIDIKREDKIHPFVSGNKFRKLKYNIIEAISQNTKCILTYGGAYSNHIAACAVTAELYGIKSIGVIKGIEIEDKFKNDPSSNPTLAYAQSKGMLFHFVSREHYKLKDSKQEILKLEHKFGEFYRIPEGGTNELAVKGCEEILTSEDSKYDTISCCVGTGGTISGLINSSQPHQSLLGFSALKKHKHEEIKNYVQQSNWQIIEDNYFGGYGKTNEELIQFINDFYAKTRIKLDPIYTGKMMFKLFEMIKNQEFKNDTTILAIHSGGIQGIDGYNNFLKSKNRTQIQFL